MSTTNSDSDLPFTPEVTNLWGDPDIAIKDLIMKARGCLHVANGTLNPEP